MNKTLTRCKQWNEFNFYIFLVIILFVPKDLRFVWMSGYALLESTLMNYYLKIAIEDASSQDKDLIRLEEGGRTFRETLIVCRRWILANSLVNVVIIYLLPFVTSYWRHIGFLLGIVTFIPLHRYLKKEIRRFSREEENESL